MKHGVCLSPWLSGLIHFLSHSTSWALLADDLGSNPGQSASFQSVGLMAGML